MTIFDQISAHSTAERAKKGKKYAKTNRIKANTKQDHSAMVGADTIRGCSNNCLSCYANRLSKISGVCFNKPVNQSITGKIPKNKYLRIGIVGDPATDWKHTIQEVKKIVKRSKLDNTDRIIFVTKLQNIDEIDTSIVKNIQVSVDPFDPKQMEVTLRNVQQLIGRANIVLRIKTFISHDLQLTSRLKSAIGFANTYGLPVLETRFRCQKDVANLLDLNMLCYKFKKGYYRYEKSIIKDSLKEGKHFLCDKNNNGCKTCGNCVNSIPKTIKT